MNNLLLNNKLVFFTAIIISSVFLLGLFLLLSNIKTAPKEEPVIINNTPKVTLEPQPTLTESQKADEQAKLDMDSNNQRVEFLKKYPWYDNIPPENDKYLIGFDSRVGEFYVDLYPITNSTIPIPQQEDVMKKEVLSKLTQIGVNVSEYKLSWTSIPK